jgi:electron transport complex protein RnfE
MDGLATGLGFCLALLALGAMRELLGHGTLLRQAQLMFGSWASSIELVIWDVDSGFLLALLPAGAFIGLGLLVAAKNWLNARMEPRKNLQTSRTMAGQGEGEPA